MRKFSIGLGSAALLALGPNHTWAEPPTQFETEVAADVILVDNATREVDPNDAVEEIQTIATIGLSGNYLGNGNTSANLNYAFNDIRYSENSQEDISQINGDSLLKIRDNKDIVDLTLSHSRRELLIDPSESALSLNLDSRDIKSATLRIKSKASGANVLSLSTNYSSVSFENETANNSERTSLDFSFRRNMTQLNSAGLGLSQQEVVFPNYPAGDYEFATAYLFFERELRELSYYLAGGTQDVETQLNQTSRPYGQAIFSYSGATTSVSLDLSTQVSDSSFGDNTSKSTSELPSSGDAELDSSLLQQDQIQKNNFSLSVKNGQVCELCSVDLMIGLERDRYFNLSDENTDELFAKLNFYYKLSEQSSLGFKARFSSLEYINIDAGKDFSSQSIKTTYDHSFAASLSFSVYVETEEREFTNNGTSYTINRIGVQASKTF